MLDFLEDIQTEKLAIIAGALISIEHLSAGVIVIICALVFAFFRNVLS